MDKSNWLIGPSGSHRQVAVMSLEMQELPLNVLAVVVSRAKTHHAITCSFEIIVGESF
jgi:hypothetical protein